MWRWGLGFPQLISGLKYVQNENTTSQYKYTKCPLKRDMCTVSTLGVIFELSHLTDHDAKLKDDVMLSVDSLRKGAFDCH